MYKLSICMMVKDEEQNLKRCLDSVKPLVENNVAELIIVDTGSKDKTVNIAKKYTNNIYFHKWNNDFSSMRNISISYAKGEWILIIDADERLDHTEELMYLMNSKTIEDFNTILLKVKNLNDSKNEGDFSVNVSPRIFRNDGYFKYEGAVHNQPVFKSPNLSIDISLTHFGYDTTDKELMEKKFLRTSTLLKNELKKDPKNLYYKYQLGVTYDMHNDYEDSLEEFREAYEILKNKNKQTKLQYIYIYCSYIRIAIKNGKYKEIINIAKEAIKLKQDYVDLYFLLGTAQKGIGNMEESSKYFLKYLYRLEKYNDSEIAKDMSIIMYYLDEESKVKAYSQIALYYLENKEYKKAYDYSRYISNNNKIGLMVNVLIPLKKYDELKKYYLEIINSDFKNNFLVNLEEKISKLEDTEKEEIYKQFSTIDDIYGLLNKTRIFKGNQSAELSKELLSIINLNEVPLFFAEIFNNIIENKKLILSTFKNIETLRIRHITKYLIDKHEEFESLFKQYLLDENIRANDIQGNRVYIAVATVILANKYDNTKIIYDEYYKIFKEYIQNGVNFVSQIYNIEKARIIYKNVNNEEDRFFILMYIVQDYINKNNKKISIKYFTEALKTYKYMVDYLNKYKDEIFDIVDVKKIKENIKEAINVGNVNIAKELIEEFKDEDRINNDAEIISIKAIIAIFEERIDKAEKILTEALKIHKYNFDLLYNLAYVYELKGKEFLAIINYKKALFNLKNKDLEKDIIKKIDEIEYKNYDEGVRTNIRKYKRQVERYALMQMKHPEMEIVPEDYITIEKPELNRKPKIIFGSIEIANQISTCCQALKTNGIEAYGLNYYGSYLNYNVDFFFDIRQWDENEEGKNNLINLAGKLIAEFDIFHFYFGTSLTPNHVDLKVLKSLNKKVVMQYWGSEVRRYSKAVKLNPYVKVKNKDENQMKENVKFISKYIPDCIVDFELGEYVKEYHKNCYYARVAIDLNKYKFVEKTYNKKLLIVHAPTSPEIKGTDYILKAIDELKEKYDFDFKLVQGMSHEEASKIYREADLIIDQILIGSYGVFSVESMAMGKPVICWISDFMKEKYPKDLPIIIANPDNIKEKIEEAINNKDMFKEIGVKSRMYVEKYHDMNKISEDMIQIYNKI